MVRPEKLEVVEEIKQRFSEAEAVFFTEFAGLSVTEQQELRRGLSASATDYKIFKLTLARLAVADLGHDELSSQLSGPTGLAFAGGDPVTAAKALRDFAREHDDLLIKGAFFSGELLPPERVAQLADLESRDVLLGRLAGAVAAPLVTMAGLMAAFLRDSATLFTRLLEKKQAAAPEAVTGEEGEMALQEEAPEPAEEVGEPDVEAGEPGSDEVAERAASEEAATEAAADEAVTEAAADAEAGEDEAETDAPAAEATDETGIDDERGEEKGAEDEAKNSDKEA